MLFATEMRILIGGYFVGQCEKRDVAKCNGSESPAGWANSFEKLLDDPLGLHTFAVSLVAGVLINIKSLRAHYLFIV